MSGIHRFLTRRDKNNRYTKHSKDGSTEITGSHPHLRGIFSANTTNGDSSDQQKKIKTLERRVSQLGITGFSEEHLTYALQYAHGDVEKAFELLLLVEDSMEGIIKGYTPRTKLLGAENREGVTCYLDALLFAMFARLDCFEGILYKNFSDEPRGKLSMLLRLWVNMLRSGKLITTDITRHLQEALAECGWEDAANLHQQDASEAFTFITEKLELPLLTLKMDIYHTGKEDVNDDHRFINERLLEVAIPEPVEGKTVTLEECLESYFNNRIEVKRYLERQNTIEPVKSVDTLLKGSCAHVETVEISTPTSSSPTALSPMVTPITSVADRPTLARSKYRRSSIIQEKYVPSPGETNLPEDRRGSYRKEVMMPAWQFFSLIPWYTDNSPMNDSQVAAHFSSKRPILGMCLKRYSMLPNGKAIRLNTYIDIPTEIGLPHFIQDDNLEEGGPIYGNFKLSLQALVCHRGNSVDSGHYISIVRGTSAGAPPSSSHESEQHSRDTPKYWMRFDDLAAERVTLVDIEQALKTESPYLLFYQILPIDEDAAAANLSNNVPSSVASGEYQDPEAADLSPRLQPNRLSAGYRSGRPSLEITLANSPDTTTGTSEDYTDAQSVIADLGMRSVPSTSPRLAPRDEDESRGSFSFSRRGSRATRSNPGSRAGSQVGENRISATFSRLAGRLSKEKIGSDSFAIDDYDDDFTKPDLPSLSIETIRTGEIREKSPRRSRFSDKQKEKGKEKSRERRGRKLERECLVM
ncbi:ubiquitin carboxyl-terminal hydrolase-domain-containing protein [Aspergillus karnatakaensis]|uniref:ubiquitin C-terminal hydrolase family protein n=1 Tax=Aspergillus karnatakaensis TaxID=1810916 RepID=UPI003CCDC580